MSPRPQQFPNTPVLVVKPSRPILAGGGAVPVNSWVERIESFSCHKCDIIYKAANRSDGKRPVCPLCVAEKAVRETAIHNQQLREKCENATAALERLKVQLNDINAIQDALEICGDVDLAWFKSVFYEYRQDKSIYIIPVKRGESLMVVRSGRDNELYRPSSAGGVAIAGYCASLDREWGAKQMMAYMLRALSPKLSGTPRP